MVYGHAIFDPNNVSLRDVLRTKQYLFYHNKNPIIVADNLCMIYQWLMSFVVMILLIELVMSQLYMSLIAIIGCIFIIYLSPFDDDLNSIGKGYPKGYSFVLAKT